eukprot:TRINITY_DN12375_c0_g4_i1.p1 TRINITY_DN12375_c0_g4~~TRINITY_DN12375_c0_g4_i1.p1  ORF type:complete len:859 (+),score=132.72 TRINITY_DN12375_c0_g4_i1:140-2716(+)
MPLLSIRALNVLLVASCVVVVGVLCTTLTLLSGNRALEDTRDSCDVSVASAFAVGESSVLAMSQQHLKQITTGAKNQVASFFSISQKYVQSLCTELNSADPAVIETWDYIYSKRAMMWNGVVEHDEFDAIAILATDYKYNAIVEAAGTLTNGPDEYHHIWVSSNNGTAYDAEAGKPAKYRTLMGTSNEPGTGNMWGMWTNRSNEHNRCHSYMPVVLSGGKILEAPCGYPLGDVLPSTYKNHYGIFPVDEVYFSGIETYGTYMGVVLKCDYQNKGTGQRIGLTTAGTDLRKVSRFLVSMDLGQKQGSLGRVFLVVRTAYFSGVGLLAGASHGSQFGWVTDNYFGVPMRRATGIFPENSTDLYVSGAATALKQNVTVNGTQIPIYEQFLKNQRTETVKLLTNRTGSLQKEDFYVRVDLYDNQHGLNWYVVGLVDREFVLGEVERAVASTRQQVADNKETVSDNLRQSRIILYIIVSFSAFLPLALTVLFVFRVTQPLMLLMEDMSHVAVMNLAAVDVDRPLSVLSEVRGMETSFKQMLRNLIEYRQYLPQSVLIDTETDGCSAPADDLKPPSTPSSGTVLSHSHNTPQRNHGLFDSTLNLKSVSLLVANLHSLNSLRDGSLVADAISSYLEPIVTNARKYRGIVDDVCGDKVTVSFNTSIQSLSHKMRVVDLGQFLLQDRKDPGLNLAASTGSAVCGNMGCTGMKKYGVVGTVASNVRGLERCGRGWVMPFICDNAVAMEARNEYNMQMLVKARMKDGHISKLYRVVEKIQTKNDEWMYQMEKNEATSPFKSLNAAVASIYDGNLEDVQSILGGHAVTCPVVSVLLKHIISTSTAPEPVDLFGPVNIVPLGTHISRVEEC